MTLVREAVTTFIENEGHHVELTILDPDEGLAELLFRTRGQMFSVLTNEHHPESYTITTAYEIPDIARENNNVETLKSVRGEFADVTFTLAHDGALFVATLEKQSGSPEAFTRSFWEVVARVREAGTRAIERIVDHSESKAAADKFIKSLMLGEQ